jgi:hypothetical protein
MGKVVEDIKSAWLGDRLVWMVVGIVVAVVLAAAWGLSSAGIIPQNLQRGELEWADLGAYADSGTVYRFVDREAGIVCWLVRPGRWSAAGVDCLPLKDVPGLSSPGGNE